MQLQTYFRILMRRGWIMLLLAVITAISAFGFSTIMLERAPVYKSTIELLIQPARTDFGQAQAAKILLRSYVAWMDSDYRAQEVIDHLKLDMEPAALRSDVTMASDDSRLVIRIDVENRDGDVANRIAREWANLFIQWRNQQNDTVRREDRIDAVIIDDPRYVLDSPRRAINTVAGAILGFLVGFIVVFILEYMEAGIVRSSEDITRALSIPTLGVIPPAEG